MNSSAARPAPAPSLSPADPVAGVLDWAASVPQVCVTQTDPIVARTISTPLGPMVAGASRAGLCLLEFADRPALEREVKELARLLSRPMLPLRDAGVSPPGEEHLDTVERELELYFAGGLMDFSVALNLPGSPFERRVWGALQQLAFAERTSYGRLAFKLGMPGAARAVGRANGRNRVAIVVPCHRVVNEDGSLCGYGGGVDRKQRLLDLEMATSSQPLLFA